MSTPSPPHRLQWGGCGFFVIYLRFFLTGFGMPQYRMPIPTFQTQ